MLLKHHQLEVNIAESVSKEALEFLNATDWKVVRHRDQIDLNITPSLTNEEYITLLEQRQKAREEVLNNDITKENLSTLDSRLKQALRNRFTSISLRK